MARTMYDSTSAADIPADAAMVAGYCDHRLFTWSDADWARFPNATKVRIACNAGTNDGHALDVEQGDATPDQAPGWAHMRRAAGLLEPCCYVNRGNWPAVALAFQNAGEPAPLWWVATLDGSVVAPGASRVIACQFAGSSLSGGHYDLSVVADFWPGVDSGGFSVTDSEKLDFIIKWISVPTNAAGDPASQWGSWEFARKQQLDAQLASLQQAIAAIPAAGAGDAGADQALKASVDGLTAALKAFEAGIKTIP